MVPRCTRRRLLHLGGPAVAALLAGCASHPDAGATATRTPPGAEVPTETPSATATTTPTSEAVRWRFDAGAPVRRAPVVADGTVYVGTLDDDAAATTATNYTPDPQEQTLFALQAHDGAERWRFQFPAPVLELATTAESTFVVSGLYGIHDGYEQSLTAVSAAGTRRWKVDATDPGRFFAPAVRDDAIVVGVETESDGGAAAYDVSDGSLRWEALGDVGVGPDEIFFVVVGTDLVYVEDGSRLLSLDVRTGDEAWEATFDARDYVEVAAVGDDTTYVQHFVADRQSAVTALSKDEGGERWQRPFPVGESMHHFARRGDSLYVGTWQGRVLALSTETGEQRWEASFRGSDAETDNHVIDLELGGPDTVFAAVRERGVVALDATTGEARWESPVEGQVRYGRGGALYVRVDDSELVALDPDTGEQRWRFAPASAVTRPGVADGSAFLGTADGLVYRLD